MRSIHATDTNQGFMLRFLEKFVPQNPTVTEMTMQNFLFLGKPKNASIYPLLIERIRRRTAKPANNLVKPIYRPLQIRAQVHHNHLKKGISINIPTEMLRMNHFWGARLQNWGEDTQKILDMTQPDYTVKPIVEEIRNCAPCLHSSNSIFVKRLNR